MFGDGGYKAEKKRIPVNAVMMDDKQVFGDLLVHRDKSFSDAINGPEPFIEVETAQQGIILVAKSALKTIAINVAPELKALKTGNMASNDPFQILGIPLHSDHTLVRETYHKFVKAYHPDRLNALDLPQEITDYAQSMLARANWAYEEIKRMQNNKTTQSHSETAQPHYATS
jgi:DnaJ-domain-containing protein 1